MFLRLLMFALLLLVPAVVVAQAPASAFNRDPWPANKQGPLKVFILAGQSNMQGQASLRTLEYLIYNEETAAKYQHWKDMHGNWNERRDVWVWTTDGQRSGNLKPGFGVTDMKFGPELGFGWVAGEHFDEQVLLIKTCWGGRSVKKDFLPPSAEMPSDEQLQLELENAQKRTPERTMAEIEEAYGKAYRDTIAHTKNVLANLKHHFPDYEESRGYELAGLVFFQGWNDMVDGSQREEKYANYTVRLAHLIRDIRRDLEAPGLPVVIGELGASDPGDFQAAQRAVAELAEFEGNVAFVETRVFWEPEVEQMVNSDVWKGPEWTKFYNVGSDRGYHYLGSGRIYYRMGEAFGQGMLGMLEGAAKNSEDAAKAVEEPAAD